MKPGSTVLPRMSTMWAPGGMGSSPLRPTALIRLPSITMTEFSTGARPLPSIKVPPWITRFCAWASVRTSAAAPRSATVSDFPIMVSSPSRCDPGHRQHSMPAAPWRRSAPAALLPLDVVAIFPDGLGGNGRKPGRDIVGDGFAGVGRAEIEAAFGGFVLVVPARDHPQIGLPKRGRDVVR